MSICTASSNVKFTIPSDSSLGKRIKSVSQKKKTNPSIENNTKRKKHFFTTISQQRDFLEALFHHLNYKSLEDWLNYPKETLKKHGGHSLLIYRYKNDVKLLFSTIYPNYPWNYEEMKYSGAMKSLDNQKKLMQEIFHQLQLHYLQQWIDINTSTLLRLGAQTLLCFHFHGDKFALLSTLYPNFPWSSSPSSSSYDTEYYGKQTSTASNIQTSSFSSLRGRKGKRFTSYKTKEGRRKKMEEFFQKLALRRLEDWFSVKRNELRKVGAHNLLSKYYDNNLPLLLSSLYPNYPWQSIVIPHRQTKTVHHQQQPQLQQQQQYGYFRSMKNQRRVMDQLYVKLKLRSMSDWVYVTKRMISRFGARNLLYYYHHNLPLLLISIYPNYPFTFIHPSSSSSDDIYDDDDDNFEFQSSLPSSSSSPHRDYNNNDDDVNSSPTSIFQQNQRLNIERSKKRQRHILQFRSLSSQRAFLHLLIRSLRLSSLSDLLHVRKSTIIKYGGLSLLSYHYSDDYFSLLSSIFPNYPWSYILFARRPRHRPTLPFSLFSPPPSSPPSPSSPSSPSLLIGHDNDNDNEEGEMYEYYSTYHLMNKRTLRHRIGNQRMVMEKLFDRLHLQRLDDWLHVSRARFLRCGGRILLELYDDDMSQLLRNVYPTHRWEFDHLRYRPNINYTKSKAFLSSRLVLIQREFGISQQKEWYRLPYRLYDLSLPSSLMAVHHDQHWDRQMFQVRWKKCNQWSLFISLRSLFSSHLLLENYHHPSLCSQFDHSTFELDVFLPSFNLGVEYQGEQHYHDIPSGFGFLENYLSLDALKRLVSKQNRIYIISIPYWWNRSHSSLISTVERYFSSNM